MWANFKQKSTGQLSFISLFLSFAGGLARIFTTIHEIGWDMALLSTYLVGAATTGILLLQVC
jgi:mannose-P-dolichol utilization defect protein 1